jgi:hypothetical protein
LFSVRIQAWLLVMFAGLVVLEARWLPAAPQAAGAMAAPRAHAAVEPFRPRLLPDPQAPALAVVQSDRDDPDLDVVAQGRRAPAYEDPVHRDYERAADALAFALARLPAAQQGDGASAYFVYLVIEECRSYLALDTLGAARLDAQMENDLASLSPEERDEWNVVSRRCSGFAQRDWSALADALGEDRPGADTEVGSVWFERAVRAGYAPALAEQALRPGPLDAGARRAQLERALAGGRAYARWLLFADATGALIDQPSVAGLAWLLSACRAGFDCTEQARWYRSYRCMGNTDPCQRGESGIEHYWYAASAWERQDAWKLAGDIDADVVAGRWEDLPWPDLDGRGD